MLDPSQATGAGRLTVPHLVTDPVWSLQPWPVTITVANNVLTIPALPAAQWLAILMVAEPNLEEIIPGLLGPEESDFIDTILLAQALSLTTLYELALEIISQVSGRPWWVALRLISVARTSWDALAAEMSHANAATLSLSGWLDVLFATILRALEDSKRQMFLLQLEASPPPVAGDAVSSWEENAMTADDFLAMARSG